MRFSRSIYLSVILCGVLISPVHAEYSPDREDVKAFIDRMVAEHHFEQEAVQAMLAGAKRQEKILSLIARPAEKVKLWKDYKKIFLNEQRIKLGVEFWRSHQSSLDRAAKAYGVEPRVIVAILGIETYYGQRQGAYRVLDALTTLGFDYPKRAKFFLGQLEQLFLMGREDNLAIDTLLGSYAGAMGYGQFIPSSYRNFSVDFDDDGVADLWNNPVDAIGCVANYLKQHNWRNGQPVIHSVNASKDADLSIVISRGQRKFSRPRSSLAQLREKGFALEHDEGERSTERAAFIVGVEADSGVKYWAGFNNFYAITRYNHSVLYALAVHHLGVEIEKRLAL